MRGFFVNPVKENLLKPSRIFMNMRPIEVRKTLSIISICFCILLVTEDDIFEIEDTSGAPEVR